MSQGGSAQMGGGQLGGPTQSGMMGGMGGPTQAGGQLGGPTQMGGMPGGQNPIQQAQMQQQPFQGGPLGSPSPFPQGGPLGSPSGMPQGLVANILAQHPEAAGKFANSAGGKGGMPGAQQNLMQPRQNPMQQQGLASLLKPQQSSTNSLQ